MTIRELIDEQRRRLGSRSPVERFAAATLIPAVLAERLVGLADRQVGQLLLDEVWPGLSPLAPESTICLHAADRLRGPMKQNPTCPKCGSEMIRHVGIDEPDFLECSLLRCGLRIQET
ncbi:MAG: hypothetical protein WB558_07180 [Terriglobales bacterium]